MRWGHFFVSDEVEEPELLDDEELEESELDDEAGFDSLPLLEPSFFEPLDGGAGPAPLPRA
jgi:hypothetical protein